MATRTGGPIRVDGRRRSPHPPSAPAAENLSVAQVADALGVSDETIYRRIANCEIAATNVGTNRRSKLRISRQALKAYLDANTNPATWRVV